LRGDFLETNPQHLSHTPFHPVPQYCVSEGSGNRESQPRSLARRARNLQAKRRKVRARNPSPLGIRFAEI
jgi:hypothetical protein